MLTQTEPTATSSRLSVDSEVGTLRRVILHRPGLELRRLTPRNHDALLFDDVLWVKRARQEHAAFADALAARGVEVLYLDELLESMRGGELARRLIGEITQDDLPFRSDSLVAAVGLVETFVLPPLPN